MWLWFLITWLLTAWFLTKLCNSNGTKRVPSDLSVTFLFVSVLFCVVSVCGLDMKPSTHTNINNKIEHPIMTLMDMGIFLLVCLSSYGILSNKSILTSSLKETYVDLAIVEKQVSKYIHNYSMCLDLSLMWNGIHTPYITADIIHRPWSLHILHNQQIISHSFVQKYNRLLRYLGWYRIVFSFEKWYCMCVRKLPKFYDLRNGNNRWILTSLKL